MSLTNGSSKLCPISAIAGANVIWGINYVISKMVVNVAIDPETLTMYRVLVTASLMWLISLFFTKERMARKDLLRLFFAGLFGVSLNQYLFICGIGRTTPVDAAIIITFGPIIVLLLSAFLLHDRITLPKVVGSIIGGVGAVSLVAYSGAVNFGSGHLLGNIMIFGSATTYALYLVTVKPLMGRYSSLTVIKWVFLFGSVQLLPIGLGPMSRYNLLQQSPSAIFDIAFVVLGATFLAYLFVSYALTHLKTSTVSVFAYTQPVVAAIFSLILGVDTLGWVKIVSMLLVCFGVYVATSPAERNPIALLMRKS